MWILPITIDTYKNLTNTTQSGEKSRNQRLRKNNVIETSERALYPDDRTRTHTIFLLKDLITDIMAYLSTFSHFLYAYNNVLYRL